MKYITSTFLTGLGAVLPLLATIYLFYWFITSTESWLGNALLELFGEKYYIPGLGIVLGITLIFIIGLLMRIWMIRKVFSLWEILLQRMPVVKSIYSVFQDFINFLTEPKESDTRQVVLLRIADSDIRVLGLITRKNLDDLPKGFADKDAIAVYIPMSYQLGGYTVFVPRSQIQLIDMSLQDAMRFAVTAGMSTSPKTKN